MTDWMAEVKGRVPHRPKRRWWAVAARPAGAMAQFPLDVVTTPGVATMAAYGLRQMRSGYVGPAVNVRRSSDNATMDIGFRGPGDLDVQTLSNFIGGGNGFVAIWYDQSGKGNNAIQATAAAQPQIMLGAAPSGKPALFAASTSIGMSATIPAVVAPFTLNSVASRTGGLTSYSNTVVLSGSANAPALLYINSPGMSAGDSGLDGITIAGVADNQFHCATGVFNGAASSFQVDGQTIAGTLASQAGSTQIAPVSFSLVGFISEAIYWTGAVDAGSIAALTANQRAYFGTASNVFTPITGNASYLLVFDDEFNGASLNTTTKWIAPIRQADNTYSGGQGEMLPGNITVHDGLLDMAVTSGPTPGAFNYGTSSITTQGSTINGQPIQCYWEARIKVMDNAHGLSSNWWTDTAPSWVFPEADFLEYWQAVGGTSGPNQTQNNYNDGTVWQLQTNYNYGSSLAKGFHTYGCWWTPSAIQFYLDGVLTSQTSTNTNKTTTMWYGVLNATVGGGGVFPDVTTVLANHMLVDYVHVYSAQAGAVAVTPDANYGGPGDCRRT